jgi:hypothetical protein
MDGISIDGDKLNILCNDGELENAPVSAITVD